MINDLYVGIAYFELAKPLPLNPVGSMATICRADGRCSLNINKIELPYDLALVEPEWFVAVTEKEHRKRCKASAIEHFMAMGADREKAEMCYISMGDV